MADTEQRKKHILITGATDGIGKEMALKLVRQGRDVVFTGRNLDKVDQVRRELERARDGAHIVGFCFDIGHLKSVRSVMTPEEMMNYDYDMVIFNAGVMFPSRRHATEDDNPELEETLKTNVLGHFLLARRLAENAEQTGSLVSFVFISSTLATARSRWGGWPSTKDGFRDFFSRSILWSDGWLSYIDSKLGTLVMAQSLALASANRTDPTRGVQRAVAIHPGVAKTNMFESIPRIQKWIIKPIHEIVSWLRSSGRMENAVDCADRVVQEAVLNDDANSIDTWICNGPQPIPPFTDEQQKNAFMEFITEVTDRIQ